MTRQTSIDAYNEIKENGLLSTRRFQVYQIVYKYGPMSAAQVVDIARTKMKVSNSGNFATRLSELREMGVVEEKDVSPCGLTGRNVIHWDVTDRLPMKVQRKPSLKEQNEMLRKELAAVKKRIVQLYNHEQLSMCPDCGLTFGKME